VDERISVSIFSSIACAFGGTIFELTGQKLAKANEYMWINTGKLCPASNERDGLRM